jgi:hypothetical protein
MMAGGVSPGVEVVAAVSDAEVTALLDSAKERWKVPQPIPGWCCDGTHSAGSDTRFMGVWSQMYAVCRAFEHYGRVDPSDDWRPEFRCFDGLTIEERPVDTPASTSTERREWIIQRCIQQWVGSELQYEDWPGYAERLMTREEMITALRECEQRWQEHEFRGHNVVNQPRLNPKPLPDSSSPQLR